MPDQLDIEAMQFMNSKPVIGSQRSFGDLQVQVGGKTRTKIPTRKAQERTKRYISDEPERFVQYIDRIKGQFVTEEQGIKLIEEHWKRDTSLKNLLEGMKKDGVLHRELSSLVNTKKVQSYMAYRVVAKKLKIKPKVLLKNINSIDRSKADPLLERINQLTPTQRKKAQVNIEDLFYKTREGKLKGKATRGNLTLAKIFSKQVPRYKDPRTGQFIKVN